MKRLKWHFVVGILALPFVSESLSYAQDQVTHRELVDLLGIRQWVVPMPKDDRFNWGFEIRDYVPIQEVTTGNDSWMDRKQKAKFILMPTGERDIHRFWIKQRNGTSSGTTRIDVCQDAKNTTLKCDYGQFSVEWYPRPKRIEDGKTYVIGEVREDVGGDRRKQVILKLHMYRLEDIAKENK